MLFAIVVIADPRIEETEFRLNRASDNRVNYLHGRWAGGSAERER